MSYFGSVQRSRLIIDSGQQTTTVAPDPGQNTIGSRVAMALAALAALTTGYDNSSETEKTDGLQRLQIKLIIVCKV